MYRKIVCMVCILSLWGISCSKSRAKTDPADASQKPAPKYKGPKVTLTPKFSPGRYIDTETMGLYMTISAEGQHMPVNMDMKIRADMEIGPGDPASSNDQKIRFAFRGVGMKVDAMGRKLEYDSDNPAGGAAELRAAVQPLVGMEGSFTARGGKIIDVQEGLRGMMEQAASRGLPSSQRGQMEKQMEQFISEMLTQHWGEMIPAQPVGPGDSWAKTIKLPSVPMLGDLSMDCSATLDDIEETPDGKVAIISITGRAQVNDRPLDMSAMGGPAGNAKINRLGFSYSGAARFNIDAGMSTAANITLTMDGAMTVPNGAASAQADFSARVVYDISLKKAP